MVKYVITLYVFLIPGVALYIRRKVKGYGKSGVTVIVKGLCTTVILSFALAGFVNTSAPDIIYAALIVAGLALGLAGDVAICNDFLAGMAFFALGHVCYITAFIAVSESPLWALPVFTAVYLLGIVLYRRTGMVPEKMFIPMIAYSAILVAMLSFAVSAAICGPVSLAGFAALAGAILFTEADTILALCSFKTRKVRMKKTARVRLGVVSTCSYFLGQSLIAASVFLL